MSFRVFFYLFLLHLISFHFFNSLLNIQSENGMQLKEKQFGDFDIGVSIGIGVDSYLQLVACNDLAKVCKERINDVKGLYPRHERFQS